MRNVLCRNRTAAMNWPLSVKQNAWKEPCWKMCIRDRLGVFKYGTFAMENLHSLTGFPSVIPEIALPIGISFYTFQLLSYVVDV